MKRKHHSHAIAAGAIMLVMSASLRGEGDTGKTATDRAGTNDTVTLRVLDIRAAASNTICIGTNRIAASQVTNHLALYRGKIDAIAMRRGTNDAQLAGLSSEMMGKLVRMGLPVLVMEESGSLEPQREEAGMRTITLSSDHLVSGLKSIKAIRDRPLPSLRAELGLDEEKGTHGLNKIELGLPGGGIWLLHEDDEGQGMTGIQIKKSW